LLQRAASETDLYCGLTARGADWPLGKAELAAGVLGATADTDAEVGAVFDATADTDAEVAAALGWMLPVAGAACSFADVRKCTNDTDAITKQMAQMRTAGIRSWLFGMAATAAMSAAMARKKVAVSTRPRLRKRTTVAPGDVSGRTVP